MLPVEKASERFLKLFMWSWEALGGGELCTSLSSPLSSSSCCIISPILFFLCFSEITGNVCSSAADPIILQVLPLGHNHMGFVFQVILFLFQQETELQAVLMKVRNQL